MTLRWRRSPYQQFAEFERGSTIELKEDFFFNGATTRLGSNVAIDCAWVLAAVDPGKRYFKKTMVQSKEDHTIHHMAG
ncbi:hypothetical protein TNCV_3156411 [Trichonephila clavipes]|nr:hypothetical protein TNCV_3156411 [Trichonephila clavipes]